MTELRPYLRLLATYRGRMILGSVLVFATIAAGVGLLALSGWFITATGVTALALAAGLQAQLDIYVPGAGIRFFALSRTAARYVERVQNHDTVLRLLADLRKSVFARLTALDPAALARFRNALVLNRLTADIDALDSLYLRCLAPPAAAVLAVLGVAGLVALIAPLAGLVVGAVLLLGGGVLTAVVAAPGSRLGERMARRTESARIGIVDLVRGLAELRAFGVVQRQQSAIDRSDRALVGLQQRAAGLAAVGEAGMGLVVHLGMVLALFLGVWLYTADAISGPLAALMPLAVLALLEGLAPVPGGLLQLGRARAAARRQPERGRADDPRAAFTGPAARYQRPGVRSRRRRARRSAGAHPARLFTAPRRGRARRRRGPVGLRQIDPGRSRRASARPAVWRGPVGRCEAVCIGAGDYP